MRSYEIRFWITWRSSLQNCAMTLRHQKPGVPMDQQKPYDLVHLRSIDAEGRKGHGMALVEGGGLCGLKIGPSKAIVLIISSRQF